MQLEMTPDSLRPFGRLTKMLIAGEQLVDYSVREVVPGNSVAWVGQTGR